MNSRFHRAVGKRLAVPPSPVQAGRPFAKTKTTSPRIQPPSAVRPSLNSSEYITNRLYSLRSQTGRGQASGIFHRANWLADMRLRFSLSDRSILALQVLKSTVHMKLIMKTNNIVPLKKLALLSAAVCAVMFAFAQNASATPHPLPPAISLTIGDNRSLGEVFFGIPSGDADRTAYVNHLIAMAPGTTNAALGQTFHRSSNNPGPGFPNYPTAVFAKNGTGTSVDLGNGTLYSYLFAKYDGPNAASEVWYVGNLSGIITIPAAAFPKRPGGQPYGLSGWTLFGPGVPGVPDGGTTVMLLGGALGALGMARRFLKS